MNQNDLKGLTMTGEEVKRKLHREGSSVKAWADANGYKYQLVSGVIRGVVKANYGKSYDIAVALGMKRPCAN